MRVTLDKVRELRRRTGFSLISCKEALEQCDDDIDRAIDRLRIIGFARINKKFSNQALDGWIAIYFDGNLGVLVELNCETDFVARNEKFTRLISDLALIAYQERCTSVSELKNAKYQGISTVEEALVDGTSILGEKLELGRFCYITANNGVVAGYIHGGNTAGVGKSGALVALNSSGNKLRLQEIGKQIAMQVVAMKPEVLSIDNLDQVNLRNELSLIEERVKVLNKSQELTKRIIDNQISKYYEEVVLLEQRFIKDEKIKVSDFIRNSGLSINSTIELSDYKLLIK